MSKTKYRFKTIREFEGEFGSNWREIVNFNYEGFMDYLAGKPLEDHISNDVLKDGVSYIEQSITYSGEWTINEAMIKSTLQTSYEKFKEIISVVQRLVR